MTSSFKYSLKSILNTKGLFSSLLIMPIFMILLLTILLSYPRLPVVGLVKGNYTGDLSFNGIEVKEIEAQDVDYLLGSGQTSLVIYLDENAEINKYYSAIPDNHLILQIEASKANGPAPEESASIFPSLGMLLFKLTTAGSSLAILLIQEKNHGILVRLKNAKISIYEHVLGKGLAILLAYEAACILITAFYHFAGFDFGQASPLLLLLVFNLALIFSLSIYTLLASLLNNEGFIWVFSSVALAPLSIFTGIIFPVDYMPNWMQAIGKLSPQYHLNEIVLSGELSMQNLGLFILASCLIFIFGVNRWIHKESK